MPPILEGPPAWFMYLPYVGVGIAGLVAAGLGPHAAMVVGLVLASAGHVFTGTSLLGPALEATGAAAFSVAAPFALLKSGQPGRASAAVVGMLVLLLAVDFGSFLAPLFVGLGMRDPGAVRLLSVASSALATLLAGVSFLRARQFSRRMAAAGSSMVASRAALGVAAWLVVEVAAVVGQLQLAEQQVDRGDADGSTLAISVAMQALPTLLAVVAVIQFGRARVNARQASLLLAICLALAAAGAVLPTFIDSASGVISLGQLALISTLSATASVIGGALAAVVMLNELPWRGGVLVLAGAQTCVWLIAQLGDASAVAGYACATAALALAIVVVRSRSLIGAYLAGRRELSRAPVAE